MNQPIAPFKAYDIRGDTVDFVTPDFAYRLGVTLTKHLSATHIVIGRDARLSGKTLANAFTAGVIASSGKVFDLGLCGTELVYYATQIERRYQAGVMITASHNPKNDNGFKIVLSGARPLYFGNGLEKVASMMGDVETVPMNQNVPKTDIDIWSEYIAHILSYVDVSALKPMKIVMDCGNGPANLVIERLRSYLPAELVTIRSKIDGHFPQGVPNPMLETQRQYICDAVIEHDADFGVAWDGDFDRCFFVDEQGQFIDGYYIVGLLIESLSASGASRFVHDPRVYWNSLYLTDKYAGTALRSKTGHAFVKETMRQHDADYGGEMSAHHYFKRFGYCDSGMIPWLLIYAHLSRSNKRLSACVKQAMVRFPSSGEINFKVEDTEYVMRHILDDYSSEEDMQLDDVDGLDMSFDLWRFSLRKSNTEPLLRLNVETRGDEHLLNEKVEELSAKIKTASELKAQI